MASRGFAWRIRLLVGALLVVLGLAAALCGMTLLARQARDARSYESLRVSSAAVASPSGGATARAASSTAPETMDNAAIDWDALRDINDQVAAWLVVEGAEMSLPVCQADAGSPDYYLSHDLWNNESLAGCLYVDCRTSADSRHVLVYGHHLVGTGGMLSELYSCSEQGVFDQVLCGDLMWSTPDRGERHLRPLCALAVDQSFNAIQRFDFSSDDDLQAWLEELCAQASAQTPSASDLTRRAHTAVSLVTCSSMVSGQRGRTIVILVDA